MGIRPVVTVFVTVLFFPLNDAWPRYVNGMRYKCGNIYNYHQPLLPPPEKAQRRPGMCLWQMIEPGSEWFDVQRYEVTAVIDEFRGMIANECDAFKTHKPKPALFREATYNCELEAEAKFECPAKLSDFKSTEKFYRAYDRSMPNNNRTDLFRRVSPRVNETIIDPATQLSNEVDPDNSQRNVIDFLRFVLDAKATEYGCFMRVCNIEGEKYELISCASDQPMRLSGPIYTPGQRCQSDDDCKNAYLDFQQCNTEHGLCLQKFKCKYSTMPDYDPCSYLVSTLDVGLPYKDKPFTLAVIYVAVKNSDHSYTVIALGVAVAEKYFLTSVTSNFKKYGSEDLYVIDRASRVHKIRSQNMNLEITIGHYNMTAWQDLALVKIPDDSSFKFYKITNVNGNTTVQPDTMTNLYTEGPSMNLEYESSSRCAEMFANDPTIDFHPGHMSCVQCKALTETECEAKHKHFGGSPSGRMSNGPVLTGIHSVNALDPKYKYTYLVTLVAPHCGWLSSVSKGAIKCVFENLVVE
uniref:G_PROTEIN_RECEP_F2_4 domain-containing protein n=1 Tax=Panagrellus redivivus TaxID=6233 RepID=A0A7E4VLJ5_PANRE